MGEETIGNFFNIDGKSTSPSSVGMRGRSSEEILQMLRASLKATSPFKFMTDFSQLQEPGPDSSGSNSSEKTQDALVWQERRKTLKPTGSFRRDSMRQTGDDTADLQSVISEQTMESYHGGGGGMFNDGEVAVANPVEWLEAKKKNLRPTSLRLPPSSSHAAAAAAAAATEEAMDDQRSVGKSLRYRLRTTTYTQPTYILHNTSFDAIYNVELCGGSSLRYSLVHTTIIHPPPSIYSTYPLMNIPIPFPTFLARRPGRRSTTGSELSQSTFTTSRSSVYGHTATSSTTKDPTRKPHSSSFLALLNPLRPVSLAKPPTPINTTTSASSQQVIPVDWKLERLKTTDEIPHPIPSR